MILLDTHAWVWWASDDARLDTPSRARLADESDIAISIISCWEVAKAVERKGITLDDDVERWIEAALSEPRIVLLPLTPRIVVESTRLPPTFHRDPADQMIVATARVLDLPLMTADRRIREYQHVQTL